MDVLQPIQYTLHPVTETTKVERDTVVSTLKTKRKILDSEECLLPANLHILSNVAFNQIIYYSVQFIFFNIERALVLLGNIFCFWQMNYFKFNYEQKLHSIRRF